MASENVDAPTCEVMVQVLESRRNGGYRLYGQLKKCLRLHGSNSRRDAALDRNGEWWSWHVKDL